MIEFRKLTEDIFFECIKLEVHEEQKNFVASNVFSIAQSYVALLNDEFPPITYAIYHGDTLIGFLLMCYEHSEENEYGDENCYHLVRFMIDKQYQGQGLGKQAMEKLLSYIRTSPQGKAEAVYLSYEPKNEVAKKLYASYGFVETGQVDDGEAIAKLVL
ncbi:N-acetyltransferase [Halalkalibacillus sediminis]|uniref:N-acetyltransferase n=1 Tax=Halalkalibacillus sediminis TaxID=2018042 RepID=A0A2I0QR41_9BACI|nr:GNAT family N-acetyltransferase [Halalkalibacillus sediminis]PKR76801.1 N-acetyltransferase [Halalkalibacillus sediminis]